MNWKKERLMLACKRLEDAEWLDNKCRLPASDGYIDIRIEDEDMYVERQYDNKYMQIILKDVWDIDDVERKHLEVRTFDGGYLSIHQASPKHYHIYAYDKNKNLIVREEVLK